MRSAHALASQSRPACRGRLRCLFGSYALGMLALSTGQKSKRELSHSFQSDHRLRFEKGCWLFQRETQKTAFRSRFLPIRPPFQPLAKYDTSPSSGRVQKEEGEKHPTLGMPQPTEWSSAFLVVPSPCCTGQQGKDLPSRKRLETRENGWVFLQFHGKRCPWSFVARSIDQPPCKLNRFRPIH